MKIVIGCRHGEAYKNLKNLYGGNGSGLTDTGRSQVLFVSNELKTLLSGKPIHIFRSCERGQVTETAEIMSSVLEAPTVYSHPLFSPIKLGVFDSLSREDQLRLYPEACKAHEAWEKGEIDISESEKLVDGMQPALDYYDQIKRFIDILPDNQTYILVGTRSDISCLKNVMLNQRPDKNMSYKYYKLNYAEAVVGLFDKEKGTKLVEIDTLNPAKKAKESEMAL